MSKEAPNAPLTLGTKADVIQSYLTAGLEVHTPHGIAEVWGLNKDLRASGGWTLEVKHTRAPAGEQATLTEVLHVLDASKDYSITLVTPILRPLATLNGLLVPGTETPVASLLAELMIAPRSAQVISRYEVQPQTDGVVVYAYEPVPFQSERVYAKAFLTVSDGLLVQGRRSESWPVENQYQVIEYLRRYHFALPVGGVPLVEGVDYIAK